MAEWVAHWPIFEVCVKETGCAGGGKLRGPWWRQEAVEKKLGGILKNILAASRERQRRESDRCGGGKVGKGDLVSSRDGERRGGGAGVFSMLGRRQGTPRWVDDPVVEAAKYDGRVGGKSSGRRRGWGGSNK